VVTTAAALRVGGASLGVEYAPMAGLVLRLEHRSLWAVEPVLADPAAPRTQSHGLAVAIQARDIFRYNESLSSANSNIAIVMLEDNLDALAYRSMRELAVQEIGALADFVRNPCLGCYSGNDDNTLGDPREEHKIARFGVLKAGDGYSFDGEGFEYPDLTGRGDSAEQVLQLMTAAVDKKLRYVGLWRHDWQGVLEGVTNKQPQLRTYIPSNPDQQAFEIRALRTGLLKETDSESIGEADSVEGVE
jgi:hypothetical protein